MPAPVAHSLADTITDQHSPVTVHDSLETGPLPLSPQTSSPLQAMPRTRTRLARSMVAGSLNIPATGQTIAMKLLVISADGTEGELQTIAETLADLDTPYDLYIASPPSLYSSTTGTHYDVTTGQMVFGASQPATGFLLSGLQTGQAQGNYYGVILTTTNLINGGSQSLSSAEIGALRTYQDTFGTREIVWYAFPAPALGYQWADLTNYAGSNDVPATFTDAGKQIFGSYVNTASPLTIGGDAYHYLAPAASATYLSQAGVGGSATALLTNADNGEVDALALIYTDSNGAQTLSLTFDSAPWLTHALVLAYGLVNWATQGVFLGERHVYLSPQADDFFIDDDEWTTSATTFSAPVCTTPLSTYTGISYRMSGADLATFDQWLDGTRGSSTSAGALGFNLAFNGWGSTAQYLDGFYGDSYQQQDTLDPEVPKVQQDFNWISHTYDHGNLDDMADTTTLTYTQELQYNDQVAASLPLTNFNVDDLVPPEYSGVRNPDFLSVAATSGISYIVVDSSHTGPTPTNPDPTNYSNPSPNTGFYNAYQPSILMLPRHPTNLYYNVTTPTEWLNEDQCIYPTGANGHVDTYQQLLDRESSRILTYLLTGDIDPLMFHVANLRAYDGTHSLVSDLLDATLDKYNSYFTLPILSPTMDTIGQDMASRMQYDAAGVSGTIARDTTGTWQTITISGTSSATVPVTGLNSSGAEQYGGQPIAHLALAAGSPLTCSLSTGTCSSTTVALTSSPNPSAFGQTVTLTATVSPSAATGSVVFMDGGSTTPLGTSSLSGSVAILTTEALTVGTHALTADYSGDSTYGGATSVPLAQTVAQAGTSTVLTADPGPWTPGQTVSFTATVSPSTASGTVVFMDGATDLGSGTVSNGSATISLDTLAAGTHSITATYSGDSNYLSSTSQPLAQQSINPATSTLVASDVNPSTVGQLVTFTATVSPATATGTVTFLDGTTLLCSAVTLAGGTATCPIATLAASDLPHAITAVYSGDTTYTGSTSSAYSQTVSLASQTILFAPLAGKTYGAPDFDPGATTSSGLAAQLTVGATDACTIVTTGTTAKVHLTGAGSCTVTASQPGDSVYAAATPVSQSFTIAKAAVLVSANNKAKIYGAALPALTYTTSGLASGDSLSPAPSIATTASAASAVGSYPITISGPTSTANYTITYRMGTLSIIPTALTITANNKSKVYGAALPALTAGYSGLVNGDTATSLGITVTLTTTASVASHVGTYTVTAGGPASSADYNITYKSGTLTVVPAVLIVTANNKAKVYGAALPVLSASYSGFVNGDTSAVVTTPPSLSTSAMPASAVSTYTITAGNAAAADYTMSYRPGVLTVIPAALTITANNKVMLHGSPIPALTASYSGLVNGDTPATFNIAPNSPPALSVPTTGQTTGTFTITVSGAIDANYNITYRPGTLTVV